MISIVFWKFWKFSSRAVATLAFVLPLLLFSTMVKSQDQPILLDDSTNVDLESIETIETVSTRSPARATLYSAVIPGLGQIYNGKYWKLPIVYGALTVGAFSIKNLDDRYQEQRQNLIDFRNGNPQTSQSEQTLINNVDITRRDRDLAIILTTVIYALNIVDAHVDAHLQEFDVNENLSLKVSPTLTNDWMPGVRPGLKLRLTFP